MTIASNAPGRWTAAAADLLGRSGGHGCIRLRAGADSMRPTLEPGQRLAVAFGAGTPRRGDILLFRRDGDLVVHRYLGPSRPLPDGGPGLRTRGDACWGLDPKIPPADVVGRVIAVETARGWRGLDGPAARLYARAVAAHDLAWAAAAALARRGGDGPLAAVAAVDRGLLRVAHAALFAACCRPLRQPPPGAL